MGDLSPKSWRRALLMNPPTGRYIREDRCQWPVKGLAATVMRPPLDLLYLAAVLEEAGVEAVVADFPADGGGYEAFDALVRETQPDIAVMSTTTLTIDQDLDACRRLKRLRLDCVTAVKGAHVTVRGKDLLEGCDALDLALQGEAEVTLRQMLTHPRDSWGSVVIRDDSGVPIPFSPLPLLDELDLLPFPARHLVKNDRYVRPDTREPQTTLQTNRGCPGKCVYCLAPTVSGARIRFRSPGNIADEIEQCIERHAIRNFFLRADTFTWEKDWCLAVCRELTRRRLAISWVANSRVDTICEERLRAMKEAGCWLISFGVESGSRAILDKMKKGTSPDQAREAVRLCRRLGMKSYTFFVVGTPWETRESFEETVDFAASLGSDYAEFSFAVPFPGTELDRASREAGLLDGAALSEFSNERPVMPTLTLSLDDLVLLRKKAIRRFYLNPGFVARTLWGLKSPKAMKSAIGMGIKTLLPAAGKGGSSS